MASANVRAAAARDKERAKEGDESAGRGWPHERSSWMPSPRAASAAVVAMLALGVAIGSATDQIAQSAGLGTIVVESPAPPAEEEEAAAEPTAAEPEVESGGEEAAPVATPSVIPEEAPLVEEPISEEEAPLEEPILEEPPAGMPEIKHVFVVMLGEGSYEETFGKASQSKYLKTELPAQGELLPNYYAVAAGNLANEIALVSGQGPTAETAADCPNYGDVLPGTESEEGQVEGNGCVYPAETKSLPQQLSENELGWRAYVEAGEVEPGAEPVEPCAERSWRNPLVFFHSVVDTPECAEADVGLPQLTADLKLKPEKFPALAYVAPSEEALPGVVAEIKVSLAYKDGGMVVVTSTQAKQPDTRSCCIAPAYPNLPPPPAEDAAAAGPVKETGGGGQVGLVLLSPFVEPGTTSETYFNHFSLLATIEELFGLEKLGYAAEPAIVGFDESIFNAAG